jgi:peptidoglycan hydrolase-like amidase
MQIKKVKHTIYFLMVFLTFFLCSTLLFESLGTNVFSNSVQQYESELEEKKQEKESALSQLEQVKAEIARIQGGGYSLDQQIRLINAELNRVESEMARVVEEIAEKEEYIALKEVELAEKQEKVNDISGRLYKNSRISFLEIFLSRNNEDNIIQSLIFNKFVITSQISYMRNIANEVLALDAERVSLNEEKEAFEKDQAEFEESKILLAQQRAQIQAELNKQVATRGALTNRIGVLEEEISDLQKAILAAKSGQSVVSVGDVPATGDINATYQGFVNSAPAGSFAVFSYGAYTHRNGMSQYGALARANSGHNSSQILEAYYGKGPNNADTSGTISVEGHGDLDFETTYLYGIAEMPSSWPVEALKAQAIAARTYALRFKVQGSTICITERCQVFSASKSANPPASWKTAVDSTRGLVLDGVVTQYSATSGGFLNTSGWDTTDKTDSGNWTNRAWERMAESPWFYRAWYRLGYGDSGSSCNRFPWMTNEEMSDIVNAWLIVYKGEGLNFNADRIISVTIQNCPVPGFSGGNPYSMAELRSLLANPVTSITGKPGMSKNSSTGQSVTVSIPTNRGVINIPASEFKTILNMRAPGYIHIPQFGFTHIDVQMK